MSCALVPLLILRNYQFKKITMKSKGSATFYLAIALVVLSVMVQQTDGRRKILRGRRVMTQQYYHGNAVPAWAISLLSGIGMLIIGGVLYAVMRKVVLSSETGNMTTYQPTLQHDDV